MNDILSNCSARASKLWLCSSCVTASMFLGGCIHVGGLVDDCVDSLNKATCGVLIAGTAAALVAPFLGIASDLIDGEKRPQCGYDESQEIPWTPRFILDTDTLRSALDEPGSSNAVFGDPSIPFARLTDDVITWADYEINTSDHTYGEVSLRLPYTLKYENGVIKAVPNPAVQTASHVWGSKMIKTVPDAIQSKVQGEALDAIFSKQLIQRLGTATLVADIGKVLLKNRKANQLKVMNVEEPQRYKQLVREDAMNELYRSLAQQDQLPWVE